jgi:hypothetical protein
MAKKEEKPPTRDDEWYMSPLGFYPNIHKREHIMCRDLPYEDPDRCFKKEQVINNQELFVCPDCETESRNGGVWFFTCDGCGLRVVQSGCWQDFYTWPSLLPDEEKKSLKKPLIVKLIEEFETYRYWTEQEKTHSGVKNSKTRQKALEQFEINLRKIIRDEVSRIPQRDVGDQKVRKLSL